MSDKRMMTGAEAREVLKERPLTKEEAAAIFRKTIADIPDEDVLKDIEDDIRSHQDN